MKKSITVITGDGEGTEVTQQSIKVLDAVAAHFSHQFSYTYCSMGATVIEELGNPLPDKTIESCLETDAILLGTIANAQHDNEIASRVNPGQGLLGLIKIAGLFASIRPVTIYPTLHHLSPLKNKIIEGVDLIIFKELFGDIYVGKQQAGNGQAGASDTCKYLKEEVARIAHLAFKSAQQRRKKLTLVDKANVLETSRLWRKVVIEIAIQYPDVQLNFLLADTAAREIIVNPKQFDVILTENLLGDILNDEASAISGSLGLLASASVGNSNALFAPVQSPCPLVAGTDIANPIGSILSAAMMLEYFNLKDEAQLVRDAVQWTIESLFVSKDIDPINFYFTSTIGELVSEYIGGRISGSVNKENIELRKSTII